MTKLAIFRRFVDAVRVLVLANITEFRFDAAVHGRPAARGGCSAGVVSLSAFRGANETVRAHRHPCCEERLDALFAAPHSG